MSNKEQPFEFPKPVLVENKINYNIFIFVMLSLLVILSGYSYVKASSIKVDEITDPVIQDKVSETKTYSLWILIISILTIITYAYMLLKKK